MEQATITSTFTGGNFAGSNINYYSVPIGKSKGAADVVESVYAQLTA